MSCIPELIRSTIPQQRDFYVSSKLSCASVILEESVLVFCTFSCERDWASDSAVDLACGASENLLVSDVFGDLESGSVWDLVGDFAVDLATDIGEWASGAVFHTLDHEQLCGSICGTD